MSHGVHAVQHEAEHRIEHDREHAHVRDKGIVEGRNKSIALLIAVIALGLAFSETLGKGAQTSALSYHIEASNFWNFFQAKTIRRTLVETAAQEMKVQSGLAANAAAKQAMEGQINSWDETAKRYRSEPDTREGSVELMARAKEAESLRATALARYHHYEVASAAYQIGIVLASAAVITGMIALAYAAAVLGLIGLMFSCIGFFAPHAVHLF